MIFKSLGERIRQGLTFGDVLIKPAYSEIKPHLVDLRCKLTEEIFLNIPLMSAAMSTVTEWLMAVGMALHGGLGIIHNANTIERQVQEVITTKRYQGGMILKPDCLFPDAHLNDVREIIEGRRIAGVLIIDKNNKLLGIITARDIRFLSKDINPVITDPKYKIMKPRNELVVGISGITLKEAQELLDFHRIEKLPVVNNQDEVVGLITAKDIISISNKAGYPLAVRDNKDRLLVGAAIGPDGLERVEALVDDGEVDILCVDCSHAYAKEIGELVKSVKEKYPKVPIIAGNISSGEAADFLIDNGADVVKVGQGGGATCTTREKSGGGVPQLTAVNDVFIVANKRGIAVVSDGGAEYPGDVTKGLAAGASCIMSGLFFAGTIEAPPPIVTRDGALWKEYTGMGSEKIKKMTNRYSSKVVPEGVSGMVHFKGPLSDVIKQYIGGLQIGMGLAGAKKISDLWNAEFVTVSPAAVNESRVHGISIIQEESDFSTVI